MPPQERKRRLRRVVLGLGIALIALVGAAAALVVTREEGDVSNPDVEFRDDEPAAEPETETEQEPAEPGGKRASRFDRFIWAHYGYTRDRRRYLPLKNPPRPPFKEIWQFDGDVLLEFPPVIGGKRLYLLNDSGKLFAIDKRTGKRIWKRKLGALAAASPAYADGVVYVVLLQRTQQGRGARAAALLRALEEYDVDDAVGIGRRSGRQRTELALPDPLAGALVDREELAAVVEQVQALAPDHRRKLEQDVPVELPDLLERRSRRVLERQVAAAVARVAVVGPDEAVEAACPLAARLRGLLLGLGLGLGGRLVVAELDVGIGDVAFLAGDHERRRRAHERDQRDSEAEHDPPQAPLALLRWHPRLGYRRGRPAPRAPPGPALGRPSARGARRRAARLGGRRSGARPAARRRAERSRPRRRR